MTKALIVVDVQKDFCSGGALPVKRGNKVARDIAKYIRNNGSEYAKIIFSKDFHRGWPNTNGGHFSTEPDYETTWPPHCVNGTEGALLHSKLKNFAYDSRSRYPFSISIVYKGGGKPSYSAFEGSTPDGVLLETILEGVDEIDVCGLAFEYCVKATAIDATHCSSTRYPYVTVLTNLTAGISRHKELQTAVLLSEMHINLKEVSLK